MNFFNHKYYYIIVVLFQFTFIFIFDSNVNSFEKASNAVFLGFIIYIILITLGIKKIKVFNTIQYVFLFISILNIAFLLGILIN